MVSRINRAKYNVLKDTREKKGWDEEYLGVKIKIATLRTGDYSIEGFESQVAIERKMGWDEVFMNVAGSRCGRFEAMLERLSAYRHGYLFMECDYSVWRTCYCARHVDRRVLFTRALRLFCKYNTKVVYGGSRNATAALGLRELFDAIYYSVRQAGTAHEKGRLMLLTS